MTVADILVEDENSTQDKISLSGPIQIAPGAILRIEYSAALLPGVAAGERYTKHEESMADIARRMLIFGMHVHIGVDVIINAVSPPARRVMAIIAIALSLTFAVMLMIGAWDYWYPFATERAWLETDDIPMPEFMQFLADWMNEGERYEKMPRWIPYLALPLGVALLTYRFLQLAWQIFTGEVDQIIASHEAEELMEELEMEAPHPLPDLDNRTGREG